MIYQLVKHVIERFSGTTEQDTSGVLIQYAVSIIIVVFQGGSQSLVLILDIFQILNWNFIAAYRAFFLFRKREQNFNPELINLKLSIHKPFTVYADQMKPMEALVNPNQVCSISKGLFCHLLFIIAKLF